jgi:hypothetical protein
MRINLTDEEIELILNATSTEMEGYSNEIEKEENKEEKNELYLAQMRKNYQTLRIIQINLTNNKKV